MNENVGTPTQIRAVLKAWSKRWRLQRALTWALRGLIFGWVVGVFRAAPLLLASRLLWVDFLMMLITNSLVFSALAGAAAYSWPIRTIQAARFFDHQLNFFDRLSAAMELAAATIDSPLYFRHRQWKDTLARARQINIRDALPFQLPSVEIIAAALVILSLIPLRSLVSDQLNRAEINAEIESAISEETQMLAELLAETESSSALEPDTRSAVETALEDTLALLNQAETLEQAVAALGSAQNALNNLGDPAVRNLEETLDSFSSALENNPSSDLRAFAEASQPGNLSTTSEGLQNLARSLNQIDNPAAVSEALDELSRQLEGINPDLADTLAEAGQALQEGDLAAAEAGLEAAAERLAALINEQARNEAVDRINDLVAASQDRLLDQAAAIAAASPSQDGDPATSNSGSSPLDGEGSGSGSGRGSADSSDTEGGVAGPDPIDTQNQPGDGGEVPFASLFVPESLGGPDATGIQLPPQGGNGDQTLGQTPGDIQPGEGSTVPYQEVFPSYDAAARQAIESGQIPNHLIDLVRSYFTSLEP